MCSAPLLTEPRPPVPPSLPRRALFVRWLWLLTPTLWPEPIHLRWIVVDAAQPQPRLVWIDLALDVSMSQDTHGNRLPGEYAW